MNKINVPADIQQCWEEYFGAPLVLSEVVAVRGQGDFYAVLAKDGDSLIAITFNQAPVVWSVTDEIKFDSVDEFLNTPLTQSFFF